MADANELKITKEQLEALDKYSNEKIERDRKEFINTLLYETPGGQRFTQDSPILPNVWVAYANAPRKPQKLILTLENSESAGKASALIRQRIALLRNNQKAAWNKEGITKDKSSRVTYIPGQIAVRLYFDELISVILPMTPWWHSTKELLCELDQQYLDDDENNRWRKFPESKREYEKDLIKALMFMRSGIGGQGDKKLYSNLNGTDIDYLREVPVDLLWLIRITGIVNYLAKKNTHIFEERDIICPNLKADIENPSFNERGDTVDEKGVPIIKYKRAYAIRRILAKCCIELLRNIGNPEENKNKVRVENDKLLWRVTLNRNVELAVDQSSLTVKADAARRLFNVSCKNITWAIVDSGIDQEHHAFKKTSKDHIIKRVGEFQEELDKEVDVLNKKTRSNKKKSKSKKTVKNKNGVKNKNDANENFTLNRLDHRIVKTLDFTRLRELLDVDVLEKKNPDTLRKYEKLVERLELRTKKKRSDVIRNLKQLHKRILDQREIDWEILEPFITEKNPYRPKNDHGTHVAGIMGADWIDNSKKYRHIPVHDRPRKMQGLCPDINLIDVRVIREDGETDEFELLAAIQFLRWMNSRAGYMQVHGANISLSLVHEVRRYACGQTPICEECNEAATLGMVIVAAAGNRGYESDDLELLGRRSGFRAISITDPGNADNVITVGSTHRKRPYEYGVSYFSSRGPTGDGRSKPDIVAPGEKIKGPTPHNGSEYKDGTSMAAPHVSAAAAMLMSRHKELVGEPAKIKTILCKTATDLGRQNYFQGSGLLDILRALQSV